MWTAERVVALLNFPAITVPFLYTTPLTDALFCTVLVVHFHWGNFILLLLHQIFVFRKRFDSMFFSWKKGNLPSVFNKNRKPT
jgi:hypothetical protein